MSFPDAYILNYYEWANANYNKIQKWTPEAISGAASHRICMNSGSCCLQRNTNTNANGIYARYSIPFVINCASEAWQLNAHYSIYISFPLHNDIFNIHKWNKRGVLFYRKAIDENRFSLRAPPPPFTWNNFFSVFTMSWISLLFPFELFLIKFTISQNVSSLRKAKRQCMLAPDVEHMFFIVVLKIQLMILYRALLVWWKCNSCDSCWRLRRFTSNYSVHQVTASHILDTSNEKLIFLMPTWGRYRFNACMLFNLGSQYPERRTPHAIHFLFGYSSRNCESFQPAFVVVAVMFVEQHAFYSFTRLDIMQIVKCIASMFQIWEQMNMSSFREEHECKKLFIETLCIPFDDCAITFSMLNTLCVRAAGFIYFFCLFLGFRRHPLFIVISHLIWKDFSWRYELGFSHKALSFMLTFAAFAECSQLAQETTRDGFLSQMFILNNLWFHFLFVFLAKRISQRDVNNNKKYELHTLAVGIFSHCRFAIVASGENKTLSPTSMVLCGLHSGMCAMEQKSKFSFWLRNCLQKTNHKNMFSKSLQFHKWHSLEHNLYVRSICIHIVLRASLKFPMNLFSTLILLFRLHEVRGSAPATTTVNSASWNKWISEVHANFQLNYSSAVVRMKVAVANVTSAPNLYNIWVTVIAKTSTMSREKSKEFIGPRVLYTKYIKCYVLWMCLA